jgi:conjugal transfer/type IV secretion protein DotA/TraY
MANRSEKATSITSSGLRFLFAPQMGVSMKPAKAVMVWFVQLLAQFLLTAHLIPPTHRALRPISPSDARLGEVLALAFANARKPDTRLDQRMVLGAVCVLLGLSTIMVVQTIVGLTVGTAHAALGTIGTAVLCGFVGMSPSYFEAPCASGASDMAQNWIGMLLLGERTGWFVDQFSSFGMILGLSGMFSTYSVAMMAVAGFLVLYNLLAAVAGTASGGKFGGKSMNQVWAPIRLILAVSMMVPIGVGGLNFGQMMVTRVAQMGSGLASNVWLSFADGFADNTGAYLITPPLPQVSALLRDALKILVCQAGYTDYGNQSETDKSSVVANGWFTVTGSPYEETTWDYKNITRVRDGEARVCGSVQVPVAVNPQAGTGYEFFGTMDTITSTPAVRQAMIQAHKNALLGPSGVMSPGGPLYLLAKNFYDSANTSVSGYELSYDDLELFNQAINDYRTNLGIGIMAAIGAIGLTTASMQADAMARGWVSASVWFNSIARINGMLLDYSQEIPVATPPELPLRAISDDYADLVYSALDNVDATIEELPTMAAAHGATWAESGYMLAIDGGRSTGSAFEDFLKMIGANFGKILGSGSNSSDEMTAAIPGALAGVAANLRLNTANPLAELSALGHRIIQMTFQVMETLDECASDAEADRAAAKEAFGDNNKTDTVMAGTQVDYGCGSASFGSNNSMGSIFMSMIIGSMFSAGVTLAFVLPMMPFIRFMFGILTWLLSLFETVIAIPIIALAHIKLDGAGIAGPMAKTAYLLTLQLFLRPTLMIFGLIVALLIFNLMIVALNEFYSSAVRSVEGGGELSAVAGIMYTVMYVSLAYALANSSFKAIDLIPSRVLNWIGGAAGNGVDETQTVTSSVAHTTNMVGQYANAERKAGSKSLEAGTRTALGARIR